MISHPVAPAPAVAVAVAVTVTVSVTVTLAQILILLLHFGKGGSEISHDALVGCLVYIGLDEEAKVEDELIALILGVSDDDGEAEDGVFVIGGVDGDVAVAKGLSGDDVLVQDVKVDEGLAGRSCRSCLGGGDASWG